MRISCIIPVWNCENYISEAVNSVLSQTHPVDEIIVVNDGSTDGTLGRLAEFGKQIIVVSKPHTGIPDTLNTGLDIASGDVLMFLDADDLWAKTKVEKQVQWLAKHLNYGMVFGHMKEFVSPEIPAPDRDRLVAREGILPGYVKICAAIRKSTFEMVGQFEAQENMGDFIDWFTKAKVLAVKYAMLDDVLAFRRAHLNNYTRTNRNELGNFALIMKKHLDRQRATLK